MVIDELQAEGFSIDSLCQSLNVSRSAWYDWRTAMPSARQRTDNQLRPVIRRVFLDHRRRYGARRIAAELAGQDQHVSRRRIRRLMDEMQLKAIQPRSFKPRTTDSRHTLGYSPNLLLDAPPPTSINEVWVADITYIPLDGGEFLYLALIMDRFSRRIVGWDLQDHLREPLVLAALQMALSARRIRPGLVLHSDRGGQYAGALYRRRMGHAGILDSMSRADNCYDNAFIESCFGTIKTELEMKVYENAAFARKEIAAFIRYYCVRRRHSALGNLSPDSFEREQEGGR
jgi:putative transposase